MAPRTLIGVLQPTVPTQIPLPVMHSLNRNKKQGYWAGPKASKNGMKPGKDNISKDLTDKQGLTRNVREERRSIKSNVWLRHQSRQGYGHEGEAGGELSEIGDEAGHDLLNEKEKRRRRRRGASLLPEPGCLATYIGYVSRMFNLSMLPHYKEFWEKLSNIRIRRKANRDAIVIVLRLRGSYERASSYDG
jgi:hypothetical protein